MATQYRLLAKDCIRDPSIIDAYPHPYVLVLDQSLDTHHPHLLVAIEQMEDRGWSLHSISERHEIGYVCALMRRGS